VVDDVVWSGDDGDGYVVGNVVGNIVYYFEPLWLGVDEFSAAAFILPAWWATTALHNPVNYATTALL
jgi:hypothetical protein